MNFLPLSRESIHVFIDEHSLKVARVKDHGSRHEVAGVYYRDIKRKSAEEVIRLLWEAKKALGLRGRRVRVVIPSNRVITKTIEVPSLDHAEIADIIRLQAGRHTPYSRDEIVVGHINLEIVLERYMKALLAIVSTDTVRSVTTTLDLAGFQIDSVHLASEILARAAIEEAGLTEEAPETGLIHVDRVFSDFIVIRKGKPFFVRNIPVGLDQLGQGAHDRFLDEIKKTIDAYQNDEIGETPARYLLAARNPRVLEKLSEKLTGELKVKMEPLTFDRTLVTDEADADLDTVREASLLDVMLDGIQAPLVDIDFMPEDLRIKRNFRNRAQEILVGGACLLIIFVLSMSVYVTKIYFRTIYFTKLQTQFEVKSREVEDLISLSEDTRAVREFKGRKGRSLRVLGEVANLLPPQMYLKDIVLDDKEGRLTMTGTSELMSTVFSFVTEFENSPYFQNVTTDFTKSRKEGDQDVADFGITAFLEEGYAPHG